MGIGWLLFHPGFDLAWLTINQVRIGAIATLKVLKKLYYYINIRSKILKLYKFATLKKNYIYSPLPY